MASSNLTNLTIPSSTSRPPNDPNPSPSTTSPQIIYSRSHSFVGPSPRFPPPSDNNSLFFLDELASNSDEEEEQEEEYQIEQQQERKFGPSDFQILKVIGQGAFGKVFMVRRKGTDEVDGNGILAMKVMRKDNIIKKNHVDYMKAERDILTKVLHPFIVPLRYSFQVSFFLSLFLFYYYNYFFLCN
jgi:p70 ribosomal S6 kinase